MPEVVAAVKFFKPYLTPVGMRGPPGDAGESTSNGEHSLPACALSPLCDHKSLVPSSCCLSPLSP